MSRPPSSSPTLKPRVVLAAGGTGGHLFPAKALAEEISAHQGEAFLITDARGEAFMKSDHVYCIQAAPMTGRFRLVHSVFKLFIGTLQALRLLLKLRPTIVVGFGGYASAPTIWAATRLLNIPTIIHEQNAVMGRANRFLTPYVQTIATSFPEIAGIRDVYKNKIIQTGNPVRKEIEVIRDLPYPALTPTTPIKILIIGGSAGAKIFSDVVPLALEHLPQNLRDRLEIVHQVREEYLDSAKEAYAALKIKVTIMPFIEHIETYIEESHLILCRGGASTIAELSVAGRPAIIVPLPTSRDDHQLINARMLEEAGGGWVIPQEGFTDRSLALKLETLLTLPHLLEDAAQKAKTYARPEAAKRLATLVYETLTKTQAS